MAMTRQVLQSVSRLLIGVVLLAQLAVSAYACPALAAATAPVASSSLTGGDQARAMETNAVRPMANCAEMAAAMDPDFANLYSAHCQHGQQSDQAATLAAPAVLLTALCAVTPLAPAPAVAPHPATHPTSALVAAPPPHTILHCCFRI